jgi:hypothetical protein
MDLHAHWPLIRRTFDAALRSSRHCAIATFGPDGLPHVTPVGFVFLRDDATLYYFEGHARKLPANLAHNPNVCILFVDSSTRLWGSFLVTGRFASAPGIRLRGVAGERRRASDQELVALKRRIGPMARLPGAKRIWGALEHVRDVRLTDCEPVVYEGVTDSLWGAAP